MKIHLPPNSTNLLYLISYTVIYYETPRKTWYAYAEVTG